MRNLAPPAKPKKKGGGKSSSVFDIGQTTIRRRSHQEVEVYINLYYNDRIKPHVEARCEAEKLTSAPIGIIRDVAIECFASEEKNIIAEVEKETVRRAEAATTALKLAAEDQSERTPEQYQQ